MRSIIRRRVVSDFHNFVFQRVSFSCPVFFFIHKIYKINADSWYIFFWQNWNIDISTLQGVRTLKFPCLIIRIQFVSRSCSAGPRHIADIFSWRPRPFLVVKSSIDSYFGISRLYLCSSWHLLSEKSSAWNPVHLDIADRIFISVCYFYFVTQTNCPEIDTLCTVSIDYRQKIF